MLLAVGLRWPELRLMVLSRFPSVAVFRGPVAETRYRASGSSSPVTASGTLRPEGSRTVPHPYPDHPKGDRPQLLGRRGRLLPRGRTGPSQPFAASPRAEHPLATNTFLSRTGVALPLGPWCNPL